MYTAQQPQQPQKTERMLGFGGLLLAIAGAVGILYLRDPPPSEPATSVIPLAIGLLVPFAVAVGVMLLPATRGNSLVWLVTGAWTGLLAAMTAFSVGIVFLIATVLLLAAFLNANWGE